MPFGTEQDPIDQISKSICPLILEALSADCQKITIIPDGIIGSIPFACLKGQDGDKPLIDHFEFTILSSLDRFTLPTQQIKRAAEVVAVGGLDYGPRAKDSHVQFDPLPGTNKEIAALKKTFDPANVTPRGRTMMRQDDRS